MSNPRVLHITVKTEDVEACLRTEGLRLCAERSFSVETSLPFAELPLQVNGSRTETTHVYFYGDQAAVVGIDLDQLAPSDGDETRGSELHAWLLLIKSSSEKWEVGSKVIYMPAEAATSAHGLVELFCQVASNR